MEPRNTEEAEDFGMDRLLRQSLSAPVPTLPPDFDRRLLRKVNHTTKAHHLYRRIVFIGYGVCSVIASAVILRGQGLNWTAASGFILAPLVVLAVSRMTSRRTGQFLTSRS
jgi:hypothetical protein